MRTAIARKSITDLTRRKTRAFFTVFTLAIAVASVGIFGVPSLMQQSMDREIAATRLADLTVTTKPLVMSEAQLRAVASVPNVVALQPKTIFSTRITIGARRQKALLIGVPDLGRQGVDVITTRSGSAPGTGSLLTESQNATRDKFHGARGDVVRVVAADGSTRALPLSGEGRYLGGGQIVADGGFAVFYATSETVAALSGTRGYTMLAIRLQDTSRAAAQRTAAAVRDELRGVPGFTGFADYPEIRAAGDYPGKELFGQIVTIMTLVTVLALLSAMVLLSNTMTTLIGEQTGEIAAMKAIGASRRQIARIYRRTALLLGALGAVTGAALGILLSNAVTSFFGSRFYGIDAGFSVDATILVASLVVGLLGPPLAALPAIRRAARLPLHEALQAQGTSVGGGHGAVDRGLRHVGFLPRTAQIGLRGAARRKRRTVATTLQVALAVGTLLALLSLGTSVANLTHGFFERSDWDVWVQTYASKPFDASAAGTIAAVPGVQRAEPMLTNGADVAGKTAYVWGLADDPMFLPMLTAGRWYRPAQTRSRARVVILGRALAEKAHVGVGDQVRLRTAAGPAQLTVIGIATNEVFQGAIAFMPLASLQAVLGAPGEVNGYWIRAASSDHDVVDRMTARLEDTLGARGNQLTSQEKYVAERDQAAANSGMTTSITVLGLLIVLISMVGLINAITMGVIERTREIGMLRCVGARARDVRRIFAVEGMVVAVLGWLVGVPLGWAMAHGLTSITASVASTDLPFTFPAVHVLITLVGTVALALLVLVAPLRRAVHLKPGDALRYA